MLTQSQQTFLQAMMSTGVLDAAETKTNYKYCRERYNEDPAIGGLKDFIKGINAELKPLHMEIKKAADEATSAPCYVLVNLLDSDYLLNSGKYKQKQMEYFKNLLRGIILSDEGVLPAVEALNLIDGLNQKITRLEAEDLMKDWTLNRWIKYNSEEGTISLTSRTITELESYIREIYADVVKICTVCQRLAIMGPVCGSCSCKAHPGCIQNWITKTQRSEGSIKCPNNSCSKMRPELETYRKTQ